MLAPSSEMTISVGAVSCAKRLTYVLTREEISDLQSIARDPCSPRWKERRARIILRAAEGLRDHKVAEELGCGFDTVRLWRTRFATARMGIFLATQLVPPPPKEIKPPLHFSAIECPCCKKPVGVPDIGVLVDYYEIPAQEAAILRAVWKGKGHPVPNERIFDLMYEDDPDGGPTPQKMYSAFKVSLHYLRARLKGSGVGIESCGYRKGFRLILTPEES